MTKYQEKIVKNTFFSFVNKIVILAAGLATAILIARTLGPGRMGVYSFVVSIVNILVIIIGIGFPDTLAKYLSEFDGRKDDASLHSTFNFAFRIEIWLGILATAAFMVIAYFLTRGGAEPWFFYILGGLMIVPMVLLAVVNYALQGLQNFRALAVSGIYVTVLTLVFAVMAVIFGAGIPGFLVSIALANLITFGLMYAKLRRRVQVRIGVRASRELRAKLINYAWPLAIISVLSTIIWQRSEVIFLGIFRPSEEVAYYSTTFNIANMALQSIPGALTAILLAEFSKMFGAGKFARIGQLFKTATHYVLLLAIPITVGLSFLAGPLIVLLYGRDYLPGAAILPLLLVSAAIAVTSGIATKIMYAHERQKTIMKLFLIVAVINIGLDLLLIPPFGYWGAAWANAAGQITAGVGVLLLIHSFLKYKISLSHTIRIVSAALLMIPALWFLPRLFHPWVGFFLAIFAGMVIYTEGLVIFRAVSLKDTERLHNVSTRLPRAFRGIYSLLVNIIAKQLPANKT